jgi:hypothetical protein
MSHVPDDISVKVTLGTNDQMTFTSVHCPNFHRDDEHVIGPQLPPVSNRIFKTRGLTLQIQELGLVDGGVGGLCWVSSALAAEMLIAAATQCSSSFPVLAGKTVLELGSGCGLLGLSAAHFAMSVTLTDYLPALVSNLEQNVFHNQDVVGDRVRVQLLDWFDEKTWQNISEVDVILGADLVYACYHWDDTAPASCTDLPPELVTAAALLRVLHAKLKHNGEAHLFLDGKRCDLSPWLKLIPQLGLTYEIRPIPAAFVATVSITAATPGSQACCTQSDSPHEANLASRTTHEALGSAFGVCWIVVSHASPL